MAPAPTLSDYLAENAPPEIGAAILGLCGSANGIAARIAGFASAAALEAEADAALAKGLAATSIRFISSRARDHASEITPDGELAAAVDPLDASGIETNSAPWSLFSLYPARDSAEASLLRPGAEQIAAGSILYGPRTTLALTTGHGTALFVLDRDSAVFRLDTAKLRIPAGVAEFCANAAEYRQWERPVQRFVDDCLSGADGPRARNFDMRWSGSLAAELQRILLRGGIYLAPHGGSASLRLVHHCNPVAMLIEQAGGTATEGIARILEKSPGALAATSPLIFGASAKVARIAANFDLPDSETSPLFGQRGLFRA